MITWLIVAAFLALAGVWCVLVALLSPEDRWRATYGSLPGSRKEGES